jgi:hypothetical protein
MTSSTTSDLSSPVANVLITRGVTPRVPVGGLVMGFGSDGKPKCSMRLELQLDTSIHWLEIALTHLAEAKGLHEASLEAKSRGAPSSAGLDKEFKACVQATVAAATFFEALYAAVLERLPKKPTAKGQNRKQKPARYAVVTEALRQAFGLQKQGTANLRGVLKELYLFRDEAVHPSARFSDPVAHVHLGVRVERRFVMFSYSNARQLVRAALAFSKILPSRDLSRRPKSIQDFAEYLRKVCEPLYSQWEQNFGELLDPPPAEPSRSGTLSPAQGAAG